MKTKTFNIGESSFYGRWQISIKGNTVTVTGRDWDTKEIKEREIFKYSDNKYGLEGYLVSVSTSYWADKMMSFIKESLSNA